MADAPTEKPARPAEGPLSTVSDELAHPPWTKAGIVACAGFVLGVLWPRLFGVHLSQTAPGLEAPAASADPSAVTAVPPLPPSASGAAVPPPAAAPAASASEEAAVAGGTTVSVGKAAVLSCRTKSGEVKKDGCGAVEPFAEGAAGRLKRLQTCAAGQGANGKLSIVATVDFAGKRVDVAAGRSSTVPSPDRFLPCVNQALAGIDLSESHDFPRYVLAYAVQFTSAAAPKGDEPAPAKDAPPAPAEPSPPSPEVATAGSGTVAWTVGTVRSAPTAGDLVARLPKGTKVTIVGSKDGFYHVKFDGGEGWIARDAIGN